MENIIKLISLQITNIDTCYLYYFSLYIEVSMYLMLYVMRLCVFDVMIN